MQWILPALALIVMLWTVVPLARHDAWWVRVFDFPRVQIAFLTALLLVGHAAVGIRGWLDWGTAAGLGACLLYQLARIWPYTPLRAKQVIDAGDVSGSEPLSIMVANVLTPNRKAASLLEIVARCDPDLLLCVETDRWWETQLDVLAGRYPHSVKCPRDNLYGMHLYSKRPLADAELKFLIDDGVPSIHAWVVLASGRRVRIHAVHPTPPAPGENPSSAERDAELLLVARDVAEEHAPTLVFGDLNDVAWSSTTALFQKISGLLDPRIGRGMFSTFHAKYPFMRWPLDHIFTSADFTVAAIERLPAFGSDHFPILARLQHAPAAKAEHEEPSADADDRANAAERIDKVDVQQDV